MNKILYNIKKVICRPLNEETGEVDKDKKAIIVDTAAELKIKSVVSKGSEKILRTDEKIIATATEPDLNYGYSIEMKDNTFSIEILQLIEGGNITYDESDKTKIVSYDAPMLNDGALSKPFVAEIYVEDRKGSSVVGYVALIFNYCTGSTPDFEFKSGEFYAPVFNLNARENTLANKPIKSIKFLKELPAA